MLRVVIVSIIMRVISLISLSLPTLSHILMTSLSWSGRMTAAVPAWVQEVQGSQEEVKGARAGGAGKPGGEG